MPVRVLWHNMMRGDCRVQEELGESPCHKNGSAPCGSVAEGTERGARLLTDSNRGDACSKAPSPARLKRWESVAARVRSRAAAAAESQAAEAQPTCVWEFVGPR
ncbi:unnamed protein product [Lampetra fluviatilis]